jgi:3-oxoacyl-[acyl-carrier protein] reductase
MHLKGKTAVVTGGSRGIGKAAAAALAKEGANIVIASRTLRVLKKTANEIERSGAEVLPARADVSSEKDVVKMVRKAVERFRRIDILVNNAGIAIRKPLVETSEKEWNRVIEVNLKSAFICSKYVLPYMVEQAEGVIINISSVAGKHGFSGFSAYSASKFGIIGLTESLAKEVEEYGIRVYAVCPGGVDTRMYHSLFPQSHSAFLQKPEDVAERVVQLCLPGCRVRTGSSIEV